VSSDETRFVDVLVTDIGLHTNLPRNSPTIDRAVQKSIRSGKPGRAYFEQKVVAIDEETRTVTLRFTPPIELIEKARREGKEIRFILPENTPIYAGKDMVEKIQALKRKGKM
jgi:hypothetical protein